MLTPQLVKHTPKQGNKFLPYRTWLLLGLTLLSVGACGRCNPKVPEEPAGNQTPKGSSPAPRSTLNFTIQGILQGTARTFTVHLQHTDDKPSSLAACTLDFALQAEGGAGSTLTYTDASNIQQTVTSQQKLTDFTTKQELASTDASLDIPMTLHPGPGVKQVTITIQLTSPGSTQTSTVTWEVATSDIITPQLIQAAKAAGAKKDLLDLLEKLNQGTQLTPAEKTKAILEAVKRGNEEVVAALLQVPGVDVNSSAGDNTPLSQAAWGGNLEVVKFLVAKGAYVDTPDEDGETPLHKAALRGKLDVIKFLVEKGANVNTQDNFAQKPLHNAALKGKLEVVKFLLDHGAVTDVNKPNEEGYTPLQIAVIFDRLDVVKLLVNNGADVHIPDSEGNTPLLQAVLAKNIEIVKLLLNNGADAHIPDRRGNTPLLEAVLAKNIEIVKLLLNNGAVTDVNTPNNQGDTPLQTAVIIGQGQLDLDVVELLVKNGADVNTPTKKGLTPLRVAASFDQLDVVKFLVNNGADVNATDSKGQTPLDVTKNPAVKQFLEDCKKTK